MSFVEPATFTPWMREPHFAGSSSVATMGMPGMSGSFDAMRPMASEPVSPRHHEGARAVAGALRGGEHALLLAHDAEYEADAAHEEDEQEARDEEHTDGQAHVDDPEEHGAHQGGQHHGQHDLDGLVDAGVLPQVVVQVEQAEHGHVDERENAQHEVDFVVDEHLTLDIGEQGCKPVGGIRRYDVEQQQKRCSFCDMSVQTGPRLRMEMRNDMVFPTWSATKAVLYTKYRTLA